MASPTMRAGTLRPLLLSLPLLLSGCVSLSEAETEALIKESGIPESVVLRRKPKTPEGEKTDPRIITALLRLLERSDVIPRPDPNNLEGQELANILKVGSPIGYELRTRYFNPGVPIADALAGDRDPALREKLVELARWARTHEVRAMALVGLGTFHNEEDFKIFQEAVAHIQPAIRFAAMEALLEWAGGKGAPPELKKRAGPMFRVAAEHDLEPILRVYAAQAAFRMGEELGREKLRASLDSHGWLERAFAARYLGELGEAKDYDDIVARLGREQTHEFVLAEYCIAALQLFPKKQQAGP